MMCSGPCERGDGGEGVQGLPRRPGGLGARRQDRGRWGETQVYFDDNFYYYYCYYHYFNTHTIVIINIIIIVNILLIILSLLLSSLWK